MKIFINNEESCENVNFVDDNDCFVGYSLGEVCCENADWFIADKITEELLEGDISENFDGYNFDPNFYKEIREIADSDDEYSYNIMDEGSMVVFRLIKGNEEKFLHLYNCHNGYYGHGFQCKIKGKTVLEGCL